MIEDEQLKKLQRLFKRVNITDSNSVRKWFDTYNYLTVADHALVMERCTARVRALKAFCGLKGRAPTTTKQTKQIPVYISNIPENWRTKEWLEPNIQKYGISAIARSVNLSTVRLKRIIAKLGVKGRGRKSRNPYCTKAWCHRHYVELQYSESKCAKLAGITRPRFADWLVKFKIPIRPANVKQDCNIQLTFFFKILVSKLNNDPNIKHVRIHKNHLCIRHNDGLYSRYIFKKMDQKDWRYEKVPLIIKQYENGISQADTAHLAINRKQLAQCSRLERDVVLHKLNHIINTRGWIWPEYPAEELSKDLKALKNEKEANYIKNGHFTLLHTSCPGRKIMQHFFDMSHVYNQILKKPRRAYNIIYRLYRSPNNPLDFNNIIRMATRSNFKNSRFKMPNPTFYSIILKRLRIKGRVLDLNVGTGGRAIACAMAGLHYMHLDDGCFNRAIDLGLGDFLGLSHSVFEGSADLVIADIDLTGDKCEEMIQKAFIYADRTKRILAYVPRELQVELYKKYKPAQMIKCVTQPVNREPNYFFIW